MMSIELLFQIAALGIVITVFRSLLTQANRNELAHLLTVVGLAIVLLWVLDVMRDLFNAVRAMFQF